MRTFKLLRPVSGRQIGWMIAGTLVGLSVGSSSLTKDYPSGSVMLAALVLSPFCVILHELGHAWAATLLGGRVSYIQLGKSRSNRKPLRFRFLGYNWLLYSVPFCGLVRGNFVSVRHFRLRQCLFIAGDPLVNVVCLAGGWLTADQLPSTGAGPLWIALILANGIILAGSVPPRTLAPGSIGTANDGMLFYRALRYSDEEIRRFVELAQWSNQFDTESALLEKLSLEEVLTKYEADPESLPVLWQITQRLHQSNDACYGEFALS